jgi:hypothetical protein
MMRALIGLGLALGLGLAQTASADGSAAPPAASTSADDPLAKYFSALAEMKLIDVESGTLESLKHELEIGEQLLQNGSFTNAAIALYAIVESPRYASFHDFVEFQNAEYDLSVALARAGAYASSLDVIDDLLNRGPSSPYWGPAHRRAVDIAIETRDHAGVLARLEAIKSSEPIPVSAAGERAYLRGRAAYDAGNLTDAQGELAQVSKTSRLYSSAVYLRGVIWARKGELKSSAEAMCEIAGTEDNSKVTFVVDDRYFTIKDLARLGLGRIAHEMGEYDDAYYHYFQIPDDSLYLSDALFEASWSMYQKRELATSRDLVHEFLTTFPTSPLWPEASLLAGYVELADCKFDASQKWYDDLVARLQPVVDEIDRAKNDPELRKQLFAKALTRYREIKDTGKEAGGQKVGTVKAASSLDDVVALLRLDPKFLRLDDAIHGIHELADNAPQATRQWQNLASQVAETKVQKISTTKTLEEEQLSDANGVLEDLRRLHQQVKDQRSEIARASREGTMPNDAAGDEIKRLGELETKVQAAEANAQTAADKAAEAVSSQATGSLRPLLEADIADARRLDKATHALAQKLDEAGDQLALAEVDQLYLDTRKVLDKAKLGKVDAIIGQKRKLDIQVQDLAAGRFPEELIGRLWNASMIGDDEEYWPFQGEYWSDEYEGFR